LLLSFSAEAYLSWNILACSEHVPWVIIHLVLGIWSFNIRSSSSRVAGNNSRRDAETSSLNQNELPNAGEIALLDSINFHNKACKSILYLYSGVWPLL
jgi:hypothetical protein